MKPPFPPFDLLACNTHVVAWVEYEFQAFRKSLTFKHGEPENYAEYNRGYKLYATSTKALIVENMEHAKTARRRNHLYLHAKRAIARTKLEFATIAVAEAYGYESPEHNLALNALQAISLE